MDEKTQGVLIKKFDEKGNLRSEWLLSEVVWNETTQRIASFVERHMKAHKDCDYRDALEICFRLNPEWARVYARQRPKEGL